MNQIIPLLALAVTTAEIRDLDTLPTAPQASLAVNDNLRLKNDLMRWLPLHERLHGAEYALAIYECDCLREWWRAVWWAKCPLRGGNERLASARWARQLHDWHLWGYPPHVPFWRFPCR